MESCPNIGGKEIRKRWMTGYASLAITVLSFIYIIINDIGLLRIFIFFPAIVMTIALLEALDKTCIVNAFFGIKNMGQKNQRERDLDFLKTQRSKSMIITFKGTVVALIITLLTYFI
jgi:hypothetical protein